jgi:hypothetical protein
MGGNEVVIPHGCPKQFQVTLNTTVPSTIGQEGLWEMGSQAGTAAIVQANHFRFVQIEVKAEVSRSSLDVGQRSTNSRHISRDDAIIQIEKGEVQRPLAQLKRQGVQSTGKEQRPQRVSLLDPTSREQVCLAEVELRRLLVAPNDPTGQSRKPQGSRVQHRLPRNQVEGIFEVKLHQDFAGVSCIAFMPSPGRVDGRFSPSSSRHTKLHWSKMLPGLIPHSLHQTLGREAA